MSYASTSPKPLPDEEFPAPAVQPPPPKGNRLLRIGLPVGALLVAVAAWQLWPTTGGPVGPAPLVTPTAVVEEGTIERVLRLTGVTSSIRYANVVAPRMRRRDFQLTLLDLVDSGTMVKPGDVVARIDNQSLVDRLDDIRANLETSEVNLRRQRANQDLDRSNLRQDIDIARAELDSWQLEAGASEIRTVVDQEIIKLAVEEAEMAYQAKLRERQFREISLNSDLRISELNHENDQRDMEQYSRDLDRYTIRAPMAGMAVRQELPRDGELDVVEVGDQIRPGMVFLKVMDISRMQVEANINQTESRLLRVGLDVRVGLDAFPEVELGGTVASMGALATGSAFSNDFVRNIPVTILIDGSHPKLIPDLSAHADVILERHTGVLRVPLEAVFEESGQAYVYVKSGDSYDKRPVTLGPQSFTHVAVSQGLSAGEEIALERPSEP